MNDQETKPKPPPTLLDVLNTVSPYSGKMTVKVKVEEKDEVRVVRDPDATPWKIDQRGVACRQVGHGVNNKP